MLQKKSKKIWDELKYLFKLSRPRFWLYLAGPALLGLVYGASSTGQFLTPENLFLVIYFLLPANVMLYGINDFFDREADERNPKKDDKEVRFNPSKAVGAAIILSLLSSVPVFLILPDSVYGLMLLFLGLSYQYSAPPLRFKSKPFLDSVSNGLYSIPFLITFSFLNGSLPSTPVLLGAWLWTMAMHTFSAIPDIQPDRKSGIETTATYLGRSNSYLYVGICWLLAAFSMALHDVRLGALFIIYPLLTLFAFISELSDSRVYWWFPILNAFIGMLLTLNGLWGLFNG